MKIEIKGRYTQAIAEKVTTMNDRVTRRAHFQAQALYSPDRQGRTEANCIYRAIRGTVQA